jgi:plastocyanin
MNKTVTAIIAVVIIAAGGWVVYHNNKSNGTSTYGNNTNNSSQNQTSTNNSNQSVPSTGSITIKSMMFTPSQISVAKGGTVTWTNNDTVAHTVTDDLSDVGGPNSGEIQPGSTYNFTFNKTGSFQYHCTIHSSMRGTIVVK